MKLYKFHAHWCAQCKQQSRILEDFNDDSVEIIPVDCEEDTELIDKYQIRNIPTMVLTDDNGEFLRKVTGITQLDTLKSIIDAEKK